MNETFSPPTPHERLERRADLRRSRLLRTIDALDARRHAIEDKVHDAARVERVVVKAAAIGAGVVATLAAGLAIGARVRDRRDPLRRVERTLLALRRPPPPSLFAQLARTAVLAVFGAVVRAAAKRAVSAAVDRVQGAGEGPVGPVGDVASAHPH